MDLSKSKITDLSMNQVETDQQGDYIDFEALFRVVRRQWLVVATCITLSLIIGIIYVLIATPLYTASADVLIDRNNTGIVQQFSAIGADGAVSASDGMVLSELQVLTSETLGLAVVDKMDLSNDRIFMAPNTSQLAALTRSVTSLFDFLKPGASGVASEAEKKEARRRAALGRLLSNIEVTRIGQSYVLEISYTSPSPEMSARVANGIADAYLLDKLNSKYDATKRASGWLQDRIVELRLKALEADHAVQKFKIAHNLVSTGADDKLVSDQQLSELNSALIVAQADSAKAQARYTRIKQIVDSGQSDAIVTDLLDSSISNDLRKKYLDAAKREGEIVALLGPNHGQAVRLRTEMAEYKRQMFEELSRIAESYKSDLDVAQAREKSLSDSVDRATGVSTTASQAQVQLRELQREADTYRVLYQSFLQRYQEAIQQQSFPVTEARIITSADAPDSPSRPRKPILIALFCFLGIAAGGAIGGVREFRDRFFRTGEQVRQVLGLEFLGIAPKVAPDAVRKSPGSIAKTGLIAKKSSISSYVIDHPLSAFAETMRSAKIAADFSINTKHAKILGVVSTLPGEGKTTVAINFAEILASQGARTLLIDSDLRNPGATRALAPHAHSGLIEALGSENDLRDHMLINPVTGLAFIPAFVKHRVPHSADLLASAMMRDMLARLSDEFDYIVLDLPPLGPLVDARAMASRIDAFLFVVEWGRTVRGMVHHTLSKEPQIAEKCLGVVLNKVDQKKMRLYRSYGSSDYYHSSYSKYYTD